MKNYSTKMIRSKNMFPHKLRFLMMEQSNLKMVTRVKEKLMRNLFKSKDDRCISVD